MSREHVVDRLDKGLNPEYVREREGSLITASSCITSLCQVIYWFYTVLKKTEPMEKSSFL